MLRCWVAGLRRDCGLTVDALCFAGRVFADPGQGNQARATPPAERPSGEYSSRTGSCWRLSAGVSTNRRISTVGTEETAPRPTSSRAAAAGDLGHPVTARCPAGRRADPGRGAPALVGQEGDRRRRAGRGARRWRYRGRDRRDPAQPPSPTRTPAPGSAAARSPAARARATATWYPGGYPGPLSNAVHGDFVVRTSTGAYATERFQTGKVTKVGPAALTLSQPGPLRGQLPAQRLDRDQPGRGHHQRRQGRRHRHRHRHPLRQHGDRDHHHRHRRQAVPDHRTPPAPAPAACSPTTPPRPTPATDPIGPRYIISDEIIIRDD